MAISALWCEDIQARRLLLYGPAKEGRNHCRRCVGGTAGLYEETINGDRFMDVPVPVVDTAPSTSYGLFQTKRDEAAYFQTKSTAIPARRARMG
jgi:hypothetical protein